MSTNQTIRISLNKLLFIGYHGLYPEEKKLGNNYAVEIDILSQNEADHIWSNNVLRWLGKEKL